MKKYVSLNSIIEEVYASEGYAHELDPWDAVMWSGKALALINAPALYIEKTTGNSRLTPNIEVEDYRGELPIDFVEILPGGVRDADNGIVYDRSTDSFRTGPAITGESPLNTTPRYTYLIKDSYIEINEETATLELAYRAYQIDDDGFPMIPDNERVKEAIRTYITYKTDHRLWRQNKLDRSVYEESKQEYMFYMASAKNALRIMSPDRREVWSRYWTRLLPVLSGYDYSYAHMGTREDLNIGFNTDI